ncbi:MAG: methylenetetrahydrofolate--tRNA-(uracil(54)-C(5))-methyltransferase (FADH(2)-oxidizing) TrmFO, partial [Faecalibacterium sp.]|nr:methylenetetrahydrofolate--tRNA-(uracil(54)-C(5))-methyltransferase (FADH(2)-oxidizing) TrmFO [Faecalibacterium sp.]
MSDYKVKVLGAGLAGCEAALWLAARGVKVDLYEQKPCKFSPAHKAESFAELICSNSLKAERLDSASGLLKAEMRLMGSRLLQAAETARVAAGGALAVDRDAFSAAVTAMVQAEPNITVHRMEVTGFAEDEPILVATGPLTEGELADWIGRLTGDQRLNFYDAVAPIVTAESLDYDKVFAASRYGRGEADYLNCPFNKEEYEAFHAALASAERAPLHAFDKEAENAENKKDGGVTVYEGCMPIEIMAGRGTDTMRFGPLRPVGLRDPRTGHRPWANVQLRAENTDRTLYNLVG